MTTRRLLLTLDVGDAAPGECGECPYARTGYCEMFHAPLRGQRFNERLPECIAAEAEAAADKAEVARGKEGG